MSENHRTGGSDETARARRTRLQELLRDPDLLPEATTAELVEGLYHELKLVAKNLVRRQQPGETMTATVVVNEAYFQLVGGKDQDWQTRRKFFGAAGRAMANVLANYWRDKGAQKRWGGQHRVPLLTMDHPVFQDPRRFADLTRAIETLERESPQTAEVVVQRFFLGFSVEEVAAILRVPKRTVEREWTFAKSFLAAQLRDS